MNSSVRRKLVGGQAARKGWWGVVCLCGLSSAARWRACALCIVYTSSSSGGDVAVQSCRGGSGGRRVKFANREGMLSRWKNDSIVVLVGLVWTRPEDGKWLLWCRSLSGDVRCTDGVSRMRAHTCCHTPGSKKQRAIIEKMAMDFEQRSTTPTMVNLPFIKSGQQFQGADAVLSTSPESVLSGNRELSMRLCL